MKHLVSVYKQGQLLVPDKPLTVYADMPRGRKVKVSVVEPTPPLRHTPVNTPDEESPTPPIEAVLGKEEGRTFQKSIDDFMSATAAGIIADNPYPNEEGMFDGMSDYWNPQPPTDKYASSAATFLESELQSTDTGGQPDVTGWYTTQSHSAPPVAAGGVDVRSDTPRPNFTPAASIVTNLTPGVLPVNVNRSHSDLYHLISDDTTAPPKEVSSGKKRAGANLADDKKKKRQKKVKGSDTRHGTSYGCIPLTAVLWPAKVHHPLPTPERVFYPQNDPNSQIEVYAHPNWAGVGVVQYVGAPYEKRLNMSVPMFKKLYDMGGTLLEKWSEIQKDGERGLTTSNSFRADLDSVSFIQILVTLYKGRAKIHIGTKSYINEIMAGTVGSHRVERSVEHCGQTVSIHVLRDIVERVGRVLTDYKFHPTVIDL